jgi:hypothetical protein
MRFAATLMLAVALLVAAGCGGSGSGSSPAVAETTTGALAPADAGPVHVHGLGYDTSSGTLFLATHTGLFELAADAPVATRVGDLRQDTMGFSRLPDGRFLGSGHPDARESRSPHLGLIESIDNGRSWRPVALEGEADFHVLRALGRYIYGFDSSHERFLVSSDGGRTWAERPVPESLVDVAIDPADPEHLLASSGSALYRSADAGRRWTPVASGLSGYLAWPAKAKLYIATFDGAVLSAATPAGPWQPAKPLNGPVAALHASAPSDLFAALHDGTILHSTNGGRAWAVRSNP